MQNVVCFHRYHVGNCNCVQISRNTLQKAKYLQKFLKSLNLKNEIFTIKDNPSTTQFDLGVSYCYPRKITEPLLSTPTKGFVNYHPAPLPKYRGPSEYNDAINNKETEWGVTVHYMDQNYDTGDIIQVKKFGLNEPPTNSRELGAISHYFLFQLFKETILDVYNEKLKSALQS